MSIVSIETAIHHLRADADDVLDIQHKLDAAVEIAEQYIGKRIYVDATEARAARLQAMIDLETADEHDSYGYVMQSRAIAKNPAIEIAILLILGTLYEHREDVVVGTSIVRLPQAAEHRLQPYRIMGV